MNRRDFIFTSAAWTCSSAFLGGCSSRGARAFGRDGRYSVQVLGDLHYDVPEGGYHAHYLRSTTPKRFKAHCAEHVRNHEMWAKRMPSLLAASAMSRHVDAAFVLQLGDLVQGDCNDPATHARMLRDAVARVKADFADIPFVTVVGNHDVRGDYPDDLETSRVYAETMAPVVSRELCRTVSSTSFSWWQGPDAFIALDFNLPNPELETVERLLAETAGARYTFVVTHGQVVPFDSGSRWFLLGRSPEFDARRRAVCRLLARRDAIVIAGHSHRVERIEAVFPEGRISQMTVNSVWPEAWDLAHPKMFGTSPGDYGRIAAAAPHPEAGVQEVLAEYRPHLAEYWSAQTTGHFRLEVSDTRVDMVFFQGAERGPTRVFHLRRATRA